MWRSFSSSRARSGAPDLELRSFEVNLYLILVNFPISEAVAREFWLAACRNSCNVAPGRTPSVSVRKAYSVNS
jgi:hypothetical protein